MDDLKLFTKSKNQIEFLVQTVHILSEWIGKEVWSEEKWREEK